MTRRAPTLAGLWSHLASPEGESDTAAQVERSRRPLRASARPVCPCPPRHLAATGGLFTGRAPLYEGVRPGLALYGLLPDDLPIGGQRARGGAAAAAGDGDQVPAAARRDDCRPGRRSATAAAGRRARESVIATLPVGYGDGFVRAYSPGAEVLVRGVRVPLVGTVAMDAVMADVTDVPGVGMDDEFVLIGEQDGARIVTNELARAAPQFRGKWSRTWHTGYPGCTMPARYFWAFGHWMERPGINDVGLVDRGI